MATYKKYINKKGKVTYYIRSFDGYDENGKQIEHSMKWCPPETMSEKNVEKELQRQMTLFDEKIHFSVRFSGTTSFEEYSSVWIDNNKPPQLAPKTYERYKCMLKYINQAIGKIKLSKLCSEHLLEFYDNLREAGINCRENYAVGTNLKSFLEYNKISLCKLSKICGVSVQTLSNACKEGTHITIENAKKIAKFLNIKDNRLFDIHQSQKGLSSKTILNHHRLISCILAQAVRDRIIAVNVASNVYMKAPRVERKEAIFLDDNQAVDVINALKNEPIKWRTALGLLIYSGMRRGELMGLEWKDIDFENGTIDIYRTSQYISGMGIITKSTKTVSSQRVVKLPGEAIELLKEYRAYWEENECKLSGFWNKQITVTYINGSKEEIQNDRLFTREDGNPMNPDSVTDWTKKFIRKYNLPKFSPHSLRHTNASLLIANGVNISTVSKRLGHSSINTTTKIYTHAIQSADAKAADVLDNLLNPAKK